MTFQKIIAKMKTFLVRKRSASTGSLEAIISHRDDKRSLPPTTITNQRRYSLCVPRDHSKEVKPKMLLSRSYSHNDSSHLVYRNKPGQLLKRAARSQNKFKLKDTNTSDFKICGIISAIILFCVLVIVALYSVKQSIIIQCDN